MRYSRQEKFLGEKQVSLNSKVIVVGCGGVGSVLVELLARGGFTNVLVYDNDIVDETNLQRQNYVEEDIGSLKIKSIEKRVKYIDKKINYKYISDLINSNNVEKYLLSCDLVIDTTDNFETRHIINSFCENNKKDWLYTGAVKSEVICSLFKGRDKLFSKVFPNDVVNERCCDVGVLSSTTFSAASLAYNQILKYFSGEDIYEMIKLDLWTNKFHVVKLK